MPLPIILIFGTLILVMLSCACCGFYLVRKNDEIVAEEWKEKFEAECAKLPIFPPPMAYQQQQMNLFHSPQTKITPQTPSANIAPMTSDEAMEILEKSVKWIQRGSLRKMKITAIYPYIAYKYILNSWHETRRETKLRRAAKGQLARGGGLLGLAPKYGEITGFPELVHFSNDVGQGQARQNVWNIAWNVPNEKPDQPFYCERKNSEAIPGTELVIKCERCKGFGCVKEATGGSGGSGHGGSGGSSRTVTCYKCNGAGSDLEYIVVMSEFFDNENYFIHGRNPNLPEEQILKAHGETMMQETNYRVGGTKDFPIQEINVASDNMVKDHISRFQDRVCLQQKQSLVAVPVYEINFTINQEPRQFWICGNEKEAYIDDLPISCFC